MCFHTLLQMLKNGFGKCTSSRFKTILLVLLGLSIACLILAGSTLTFHSFKQVFTNQTRGLRSYFIDFPLNTFGFRLGLSNQTDDLNSSVHTPQQKMLIYMCVEDQRCAGWSDRQRSLVAMFLLALVTNRRFGILLTAPCDVRKFYVPNAYDWSVDKKDLEGRTQRMIYPAGNLTKIDFNQKYPEDVLFARVNLECFPMILANPHFKPFLPKWAKQKYGNYFHDAWEILMKPAPILQRRLDTFLESVNFYNRTKPLVGVHVRVGRNPSNPYEEKIFNSVSKLGMLWGKVEYYVKNGSQLFVASDSEQVRQISRGRFGSVHHDTGGLILHVGKQRHDVRACQGFGDAIFDQLVLSYCDILFRSTGGFSLRASYMNRKVRKMHVINNGKVSG